MSSAEEQVPQDDGQFVERLAAVKADMDALRAALRQYADAGAAEHERALYDCLARCGVVSPAGKEELPEVEQG